MPEPPIWLLQFKEGDRVFAGTDQFFKSGDQGGAWGRGPKQQAGRQAGATRGQQLLPPLGRSSSRPASHPPCPCPVHAGTDGEFVAADEHTVCLIPEGVSFLEAAAVPVAGLTAWQALERVFPLEGKRVLIHGGAGGVGGFAIQVAEGVEAAGRAGRRGGGLCGWKLAAPALPCPMPVLDCVCPARLRACSQRRKLMGACGPRHSLQQAPLPPRRLQIAKAHGAHVTTTCSSAKVDYVSKKLGADVVIDYTKVSPCGPCSPCQQP